MPHLLVTIPFSHFCEKARWALDLTRTPYVERRLVPPLHLVGTVPLGGRSTPLLRTEDGQRLTDSTDILRWLDDRSPGVLYPGEPNARAEVETVEDELDRVVGPDVSRVVYHAIFSAPDDLLTPLFRASARGAQRAAAPALAKLAKPVIRRALTVTDEGAARSTARLEETLAALDARLANREYLVGEAPTAADLTLAALLAPLVQPAEHPVTGAAPWSSIALDALRDRYRARPSGRHALRLYSTRPASMER